MSAVCGRFPDQGEDQSNDDHAGRDNCLHGPRNRLVENLLQDHFWQQRGDDHNDPRGDETGFWRFRGVCINRFSNFVLIIIAVRRKFTGYTIFHINYNSDFSVLITVHLPSRTTPLPYPSPDPDRYHRMPGGWAGRAWCSSCPSSG